jgi:hypothetical protein
MTVRWLSLISVLPTMGCALQVSGGKTWTGSAVAADTATVTMTMHALRKSNGIVGVRLGTVFEDGLAIRHGILHGGYDIIAIPGWLTLEPGLDLGAGSPASQRFDGVGAYGGVSGTARLRVVGMGERETTFNIAFPMVEIVLLPRWGMWMPPEGSNTRTLYGEFSAEIGLRFAIGSDLATTSLGRARSETEGTTTSPNAEKR